MKYIDIAFIIPLKEEFDHLLTVFKKQQEFVDGTQFWVELDLGHGLTGAAILQDAMGKAAATRATEMLLGRYNIGIIALIGIAGGLAPDVGIGDVCFSGPVYDIVENTKVSDGGKGKIKIDYNTIPYKTDTHLSFSLKYISLSDDVKPHYESWQTNQYYRAAELISGEFIGRGNKNEKIGIPQLHEGSIVCGSVSKSDLYKSNVSTLDRKLLAIETEAGGVFASAERKSVPAVVIRGISDYADKNKNKLEEQTSNKARQIAIDNVMCFVKVQFENSQFIRFLTNRRDAHNGVIKANDDALARMQLVPAALDSVRDEVHEQLTQLSPEYQGKSRGYRLPLPRVKYAASNATVNPKLKNFDPVNILEAVTKHPVLFLTTPKSYPDNSLPWIIAAELSLIEIEKKQVVPIVIDGGQIKPPTGSLAKQASADINALISDQNSTLTFVIYNFDAGSRTRAEFLRSQMEQYPTAHFIILNKQGANLTDSTPLLIGAAAEKFELCPISFSELSAFFKRAFNLEDQQAGVLTLRLQDMFKKFDLNAHPSYFAALGNDVLTSLLKANRRSELLQLAVGGFLSFVVAGDKDDVVLSRTTRETFLKKFVYHSEFLKERFDNTSLIEFVNKFAEEKDFEIDSILFIGSFQEKGILHFDEEGYARISLPFIESYLLAQDLADKPDDAIIYFDVDSDDFDYPTFDIYCELNVSVQIADSIMERMHDSFVRERSLNEEENILLSNSIRPASIDNPKRIKALQDQLEKAVADVVGNRPNSAEKQRILDVAEKIESEARQVKQTRDVESDSDVTSNSSNLRQLFRIWSVAIVLLGAGSEKLDRDPKRKLSRQIVEVGSLLIDRMLRTFPRKAFDQLKLDMQADESIRSLFDIPANDPVPEKHRVLIDAVIDAYEFSLLGYPMRIVLEQLGNLASQPVLRSSVSSVESEDAMEHLIARIWAAEIDASREKNSLIKAVTALPNVPFLRVSLSSYFIVRVFWNHWLPENRLALLDAAEAALKPLHRTIDRGEIQRMIAKASSEDA
ncbi:hypothetical protein [Brucella pituitosa]|uniref:Nucleoside phosphorylase domain-containing protein n=1 Tax=Brucella pituitosa TaxID=571256 RepID=A0A643ETW6_9HYPH|nr:hypothetical protein [Brucella pituitosa]KAB0566117.1 hypothetical protein F7Q93_21995 [Brucella pituitosa]